MSQLPTKPYVTYEWVSNCLNIGKITFGYLENPEKNKFLAHNLLEEKISKVFEDRDRAVHWLTDQMLTWLYKAGVTRLP